MNGIFAGVLLQSMANENAIFTRKCTYYIYLTSYTETDRLIDYFILFFPLVEKKEHNSEICEYYVSVHKPYNVFIGIHGSNSD